MMEKEVYHQNQFDRKVIWAEIKVLERNFKRNQELMKLLQSENDDLIKQLGEKLDQIQEMAEQVDIY